MTLDPITKASATSATSVSSPSFPTLTEGKRPTKSVVSIINDLLSILGDDFDLDLHDDDDDNEDATKKECNNDAAKREKGI